jgi:hypothetical protein
MSNDLKPSIAQAAANQAGARTGSSGSHVRGDASRRSRQRTPSSPGKPPESSALLSVGQIQQRPIAQLIPYAPNARTHSPQQIRKWPLVSASSDLSTPS